MKSIISVILLQLIAAIAQFTQTTTQPIAFPGKNVRDVTITEAVDIFLKQNLQLVAARYDIRAAEAEKITAKLRPNPEFGFESSGLPVNFNGPWLQQQTFDYTISQDLELGGKRKKRITVAEANVALANAQFENAVWQMTNDVKRKFYTVLLNRSLLDLAHENQKTFESIVDHTRDVFRAGEISGLDLQRLEVEKLNFDTDVANAERDYEIAKRELRLVLGGDYRTAEFDAAGTIEYYREYDISLSDLRDKAIAARPDLRVAKVAEQAADANITLQDAQRIPNLTITGGISQIIAGGSNFTFGVGITLPVSDRNQGERAKALIDKQRAQNAEAVVTNQIFSDVDKAVIAVNLQRRRVDLFKNGVLKKVTDIQTSSEAALKAGENSVLELLDSIRTRRETLAAFYQAIFDYQSALLDVELATATPLPK